MEAIRISCLALLLALLPAGGCSLRSADTAPDAGTMQDLATDGAVKAFVLPQPGSGATTVAIAPDGRVWFTESAGNRIGVMDRDGGGYAGFDLPPGSAPRIIALGADGNMWFSEHGGNRISRITPQGDIRGFDIPTPASQPRAIALGADGNIWFGEFAGNRIGRITPEGVITEFELPTADSGPRALAAGPDGNIWYSAFRASRIGRISPHGEITEFPLPHANSGPGDITAGADGAMWFLQLSGTMDGLQVDGGRVGRITMDGEVTEFDLPTRTPSPINITVGPDRNIWYTQGSWVGRVTPDGVITQFQLGEGSRGAGLSAGSDRRPPDSLGDRLYVADGGANRIAWLEFAPAR